MPRCPVCQTRYVASKTERCPMCGWDVQPLSLVTGLIPEVAQKEAVRLEWAKQLWSKARLYQDQIRPFQIQLQEFCDREKLLQAQLEKSDREAVDLAETVRQCETTIAQLQEKLEQAQPLPLVESIESEQQQLETNLDSSEEFAPMVVAAEPSVPRSLHSFIVESITLHPEGQRMQRHTVFSMQELLETNISLEMVYIPSGSFWMGSPEAEAGRDLHESPRHLVTIAPFFMGRFPITQAQWKAIAALPKIKRSLNLCPADFEGHDRPVEQVSWNDAIEFCARLSQKTGRHYRLPSEAEWEYACRAGTTTPFHFGETIAADLANYDGIYTYSFGTESIYRQETTPVWMFSSSAEDQSIAIANAFGLSDVHGNVWEWCADAWHETYEGAPNNGSLWESDDEVTYRVLRGGAWYCLPELCRSAQRHWNQPDMSGSGIGFRVACSI